MKHRWIVLMFLAGVAAVLLAALWPVVRYLREQERERVYLESVKRQIDSLGAEQESRHLNLAKWYNWNLTSESPDPGFPEAYSRILGFQDGVMALLILPEMQLPVYHQGDSGAVPGAVHRADSAFPIGGRGNSCVMILPQSVDLHTLQQGTTVKVCCAGRRLFYRVLSQEEPVPECPDTLTLVPESGSGGVRLVRCDRITVTPAADQGPDSRMLCSMAVLAVLLCMAPVCAAAAAGKRAGISGRYRKS